MAMISPTASRWLGLFTAALGLTGVHAARGADRDWPSQYGDSARSHYSPLDQINTSNVKQLEIAWTYRTGDMRADNRSQIQCNPLIIDGVMYGTTAQLKLFALDAGTGTELWRFDHFADTKGGTTGVNRGVSYWKEGNDSRILFIVDRFMYAIDARTGKPITTFGEQGRVDLKLGLGRDVTKLALQGSTPGTIFGNLIMVPMRLGEGPSPVAPGHIRAYDIRTGKQVWRFNTIPHPGEYGYDTWPPDAWTHIGAANCWAGMAVDEERGLLYVPTGSPAFDFWGGNRIGANLFANCLICLDARTGRRKWHFQFVHHDVWDRDLPAPPNLLTVERDGKKVAAVAQVTKSGHVFVFNRETGEPLFPIEERPAPQSDLQGESLWPTQPVPVKPKPFTRQLLTAEELGQRTPEIYRASLERFFKLRPHTFYPPPSKEGTIIFPGFDGGAEWGGAATDPQGVLYVNANEAVCVLNMVEVKREGTGAASAPELYAQICAACHGNNREGNPLQTIPPLIGVGQKLKPVDIVALLDTGKGVMPSFAFLSPEQKQALADYVIAPLPPAGAAAPTTAADRKEEPSGQDVLGKIPYAMTGYNRWYDTNGYPIVKPPWGSLSAIDLNTGEFRWRVPLGEYPELTAQGMPPTGTENYGGPVVTAGGLLFIGASKDEMFRAFDTKTGKIVWQVKLSAGGYATPSTFSVKGRQYVVIACGGGKLGTKSGDSYIAFALPAR
jgi:quinoprotein glucose dehydrogenase